MRLLYGHVNENDKAKVIEILSLEQLMELLLNGPTDTGWDRSIIMLERPKYDIEKHGHPDISVRLSVYDEYIE